MALSEYRNVNLGSLGACVSSTVKIEVVIPIELLLASETRVHQFAALQLA